MNPNLFLDVDDEKDSQNLIFRKALFDKRIDIRRKLISLQRQFADCIKFDDECLITEDETGFRRLAVTETATVLEVVAEKLLLFEAIVTVENEAILIEIVDLLYLHAVGSYNRTVSGERKALWGQTWRNVMSNWPSLDRWFHEYKSKLFEFATHCTMVGAFCLFAHFAPTISAGVASVMLIPGFLGVGIGVSFLFLWWHQTRNRRRDMARLTYEHIKILKATATDPKILRETLTMLKQTCKASYKRWRQVMPIHPECAMCLSDIEAHEPIAHPICPGNHSVIWHERCLTPWMNLHATCPLCRQPCLIQVGNFE